MKLEKEGTLSEVTQNLKDKCHVFFFHLWMLASNLQTCIFFGLSIEITKLVRDCAWQW